MSEFPAGDHYFPLTFGENEKYFNLDFSTANSQFDLGFGASVITGDSCVFWAKYGETSFSAVQTAHENGLAVFLLRGDKILSTVEITDDVALFGSISQIWAYYSSLTPDNAWASNDVQLASQNMIPYQVADVLEDLTDSALSDDSKNPVQNKVVKAAVDAKYTKPSTGIPATDLASDVQDAIVNAIQDPAGFHAGNVLTQTSSGGVSTESWEQVHDIPVIAELSVDANDNLSVSEDISVYRYIGTPYTWQGKQPAVRLTWPDGTERTLILTSFNSGKAYWFASSSDDTDYALGLLYVSKTRKWMWTYSHSVKYAKPATGIPATDLADEVQTSLGKADTALQTAPVNSVNGKAGAVVLNASDVGAGTYSKPSGGIPKTDLATAVQTSLDKADTALQSIPSTYRTAADQDVIDAAQDTAISGKLSTTGNAYRAASIPMGHLDSTSTATVMTATVPGITELRDGVCMWLTNGVITSAANFTIDINNLGAKPVYGSLAAATRSTTVFGAAYTMLFIYNSTRVDGGCWDCVYGYDTNTNTIGYQLRTNSTTMPMASIVYRYRLLFTSADGKHLVPANNSSSTNATASRTVCQTPIDPFGTIYYYGTTASVAANANPAVANLWTRYVITLGYSFNRTGAALVLTNHSPVYIKAAPQADGSAIIDADTPYVQTLPTTEDGKIYIFLGIAAAATTVELQDNHPVYCYRKGAIRKWTGLEAELDALDILDEEEF